MPIKKALSIFCATYRVPFGRYMACVVIFFKRTHKNLEIVQIIFYYIYSINNRILCQNINL